MPRKIIDEFSDLPVSRERKRQLRRIKEGRCFVCGRPALSLTRCHWHMRPVLWKPISVPILKGMPQNSRKAYLRKAVAKTGWMVPSAFVPPIINRTPAWMRGAVSKSYALD